MTPTAAPTSPIRTFRGAADWRRLHDLVVRAYRLGGRWRTWTPDRIDGFLRGRTWDEERGAEIGWRDQIGLWETAGGTLVAAVHPEGPDEAYLEIQPGWEHLAGELMAWAEARHGRRLGSASGAPQLLTYSLADDVARQELLRERGYADLGPMEVLHARPLLELPALDAPSGYRVRQPDLTDARDRERFIEITRLVFGVSFDARAIELEALMLTHREYFVAEAIDGTFAAWCGVWSVPEIGVGQFEPVGTHPDHRRRGLASAVMRHGLHWMRDRGLNRAFVGTGARNASNHLYASLGFELADVWHQWARPV